MIVNANLGFLLKYMFLIFSQKVYASVIRAISLFWGFADSWQWWMM